MTRVRSTHLEDAFPGIQQTKESYSVTQILDGKSIAAQIRGEVANGVASLVAAGHRAPGLAAVLVGENPASKVYVGSKTKACAAAGMESWTVQLPANISEGDLRQKIQELNENDEVDGILVQLPIPKGLPEREILSEVAPTKDVDGFHPASIGRLWAGEQTFVPATPSGVLELLDRTGTELEGKHAVVVGRSLIVGKPMAALLLARNCTVTICHSRTQNLANICRQGDILVAAVGRTALISAEFVKEGAVVIDVGMNRLTELSEVERLYPGDPKRLRTFEKRGSVLTGDVDFSAVYPKVSAITPVPGGVGPLTVAMVLANTLEAARRRFGATVEP
ncbi:MAG: bifunctional methylenetetrahydrofolate dehydrogenase/methenyltetrahydrofolate cyclohydrolase FolD [Deltaproteobacteria bacterium]|nr:bifunctional methylenetetrahydrofolate dehydrogenase/methenyltetrahydrofolate cyclohydrolase FolD [Deltaproteobacteria bacterium]